MRRVDYRTDKLAQLQQCFPNPAQIIDLHLGTKLRTSGIYSKRWRFPCCTAAARASRWRCA